MRPAVEERLLEISREFYRRFAADSSRSESAVRGVGRWMLARAVTLTRVYLTLMGVWLVARAAFGDGWWWLALLNVFALYLFVPLPGAMAIGLATRRFEIRLAGGAGLIAFLWLYGGLFLPAMPWSALDGPSLSVMTYNVWGFNGDVEGVVRVIRSGDADLVALQELTPEMATGLESELREAYPFRIVDPQPGVTGMGVLSRLPIERLPVEIPGRWVGVPMVVQFRVAG